MSLTITGGQYKGLPLRTPDGKLMRPTSGRVRESLFSILQTELPDCRFLDLCAGVGSVGLDAFSRGATHVTLVENHPRVLSILESNYEKMGRPLQVEIKKKDALKFYEFAGATWDIVYADPPYTVLPDPLFDVVMPLVAVGGVGLIQISVREKPSWLIKADRIKEYGESKVAFFYNTNHG